LQHDQVSGCAMTYHAVIVFSTFAFIGIAMLATFWEMGR
jgi:hypothetical protein